MPRNIDFNINNSALLVIDMQRYFTDKNSHAFVAKSVLIKSKIKKLISLFTENKRPIIMTRHINNLKNAGMMSKWWSDLLTEENNSEIDKELVFKNTKIFKKSQYDAFYKTKLEAFLRKKKIKQLVITGVLTHLCCETTARSAFMRGFEVFFVTNGTASYSEDFHKASILNLSHGFAILLTAEDLCKDR